MNWLFKEEPSSYSFDDLVADRRTVWRGVKNPLAQKHLRAVKRGDRILYYHTGSEKAVVGVATALGDAYTDPEDRSGKLAVVDVGAVRKLASPGVSGGCCRVGMVPPGGRLRFGRGGRAGDPW